MAAPRETHRTPRSMQNRSRASAGVSAILARVLLSLSADPCPPKTRADLEWDRVLGALADRCRGPLGRALALTLPFAATREEARALQAQSAEATRLLDQNRALPVGEVDDVRQAVERVRVGGILAPEELRALGR